MIEVRYAGAVVGRTAIIRELDTRGLFLGITEPLPVGTPVILKVGDRNVPGKVAHVSESQELARAGMRVRFTDAADAAVFGTPDQAEPEVVEAAPPPPEVVASAPVIPEAVPEAAALPGTGSHRRIVVDASAEKAHDKPPEDAADRHTPGPDDSDPTGGAGHGAAGGDTKKGRRTRRK